jgi:hypothetical protein
MYEVLGPEPYRDTSYIEAQSVDNDIFQQVEKDLSAQMRSESVGRFMGAASHDYTKLYDVRWNLHEETGVTPHPYGDKRISYTVQKKHTKYFADKKRVNLKVRDLDHVKFLKARGRIARTNNATQMAESAVRPQESSS